MHTSTPWLFTSYEKIPDSPQQWGLDPAGFRALEKARWVVTQASRDQLLQGIYRDVRELLRRMKDEGWSVKRET